LDLAAIALLSPDRDLADDQAEPTGQEQHLGVEGEPVQSSVAEHLQRGVATKALQAALGVTEGKAEQSPDGPVEEAAGQPAGRWAGGPTDRPRANGHRSLGERGRHPGHLSWPIGTVGVGEHDQLTFGLEHAGADAKALAMIRLAADDPNPVVPCRNGAGDGEGLIGRPVVHDQDLDRTGFPRQLGEEGGQRLG
jgi:hypothetical protein